MSNSNEQTIQFPVALKPLLTDFVLNVLRDRIPSDDLFTYAAQYFAERQFHQPSEQTGVFLNQQSNDEDLANEKQRRKSVWGGSPVTFSRSGRILSIDFDCRGSESRSERERSDEKSGTVR